MSQVASTAFREKVKQLAGVGRASLEVWPHLCIGTVIKRTEKKRVVEITRKMAHGLLEQAEQLLQLSGGGSVFNKSRIEHAPPTRALEQLLCLLKQTESHLAS